MDRSATSRATTAPIDPQLVAFFKQVDTDGSGLVSSDELGRALRIGGWKPFDSAALGQMIKMFDHDEDGMISLPEFAALWTYLSQWKTVFDSYDADKSGTIDPGELRVALFSFGYNLSSPFVSRLCTKYARFGSDGGITFDNFITLCVELSLLTHSFRHRDPHGNGWIQCTYEQFLDMVFSSR